MQSLSFPDTEPTEMEEWLRTIYTQLGTITSQLQEQDRRARDVQVQHDRDMQDIKDREEKAQIWREANASSIQEVKSAVSDLKMAVGDEETGLIHRVGTTEKTLAAIMTSRKTMILALSGLGSVIVTLAAVFDWFRDWVWPKH